MKEQNSIEETFVLEEAFTELNLMIEEMSANDISLEDSFRIYKEGMDLLRKCNESIDIIEKQVMILKGGEEVDS